MKNLLKSKHTWLFLAGILAFSLLSPKWLIPGAAWIAPAFILVSIKDRKLGRSILITLSILFCSGLISNYRVFPFPSVLIIPFTVQLSILGAIPYVLSNVLIGKWQHWTSTLIFPSLAVTGEYLNSFSGGGVWGSIANTQADFIHLVQIASVTGVWGISFLIYWFSSLLVWVTREKIIWTAVRIPVTVYSCTLVCIILFGMLRTNPWFERGGKTTRVAGITAWSIGPLLQVYEDVFGESLDVNPELLTQTSPELAFLNKALVLFLEDPFHPKFNRSHRSLLDFQDSLFAHAEKEAKAGAAVITFSEALMITVKPIEGLLFEKARAFSKRNSVRMLLTVGSFIPGTVEPGKPHIENKAIMINENGIIENIFFKNKPVPFVEGSIPGDGNIPVVETAYGRIATSICYDADFPALIRKAGASHSDIMLLPSGDWREVSPYHGNMSRLRAIENGFSLFRPVSGATSLACDHRGRIIASKNFNDPGERILVGYLPTEGVRTIYAMIGDVFAWLCMLFSVGVIGFWIYQKIRNSRSQKN